MLEEVYRKEGSRALQEDQLSPLGMGAVVTERPKQVLCSGAGEESWGLGVEDWRKSNLQLAYLVSWTE